MVLTALPPLPVLVFVASVAIGSLAAILVGHRVFLPDIHPVAFVREFVRTDWKYLGVAWTVTLGVNELAHRFHADRTFTAYIYRLEGPTVAAFQAVASTPLTVFFTVVYLVGFPFLVLFTYLALKAHDETEAYRYALAYILLVLLSVPFFLGFPVAIPGLYLLEVQPLMLDLSPVIEAGIVATDTLIKAFPSLHTGLSVLAALYARNTDGRYRFAATLLAGTIVVSTLYLGVHWLTDAVFAVLLVLPAYYLSRRLDPSRLLPVPTALPLSRSER